MYREDGPDHLRAVGETEFLNGQAAMAASGLYGEPRVAAGIVGYVDLAQGDRSRELLEAHLTAAPYRFKGVRQEAVWDADKAVLGGLFEIEPHLYAADSFRNGFRHLASLNLSFDAFVLEPQLADVVDLARSFPDTQIVLDHLGNPVGNGPYAGKAAQRFPEWNSNMREIARYENVVVKVGGLGSFLSGSPLYRSNPVATVGQLVEEWRPYALGALELFGAQRCMFESNVPTDGSGSFETVCSAYKTIFASCSIDERRDIFARTAARIYRLDIPDSK